MVNIYNDAIDIWIMRCLSHCETFSLYIRYVHFARVRREVCRIRQKAHMMRLCSGFFGAYDELARQMHKLGMA